MHVQNKTWVLAKDLHFSAFIIVGTEKPTAGILECCSKNKGVCFVLFSSKL